jgi:hypothetical protein
MGNFAVLSQPSERALTACLKVKRLHVNIWALRGLWIGRRLLYFDVGVELELAHCEELPGLKVHAVELLLPFRVEEGKWPNGAPVAQDLYTKVIDDHSGALIFGSPITVETANGKSTVGFEGNSLHAVRVVEASVKAVEDYAGTSGSSLYTVPFQRPLEQGESIYFRTRWRVFGAAPLWRWTRQESGAHVDFRICDTRQGPASQRDQGFLDRILTIAGANVFVMAPGRFGPTNVSPEPKHIRALEPGAWTDYLSGAASRPWMASDLLVYAWARNSTDGGHPITENHPFRIFLAVNRPAARPGWLSVGYAAIGFALAWTVVSVSSSLSKVIVVNSVDLSAYLGIIGVTSLLAAWSLIQKLRPYLADRLRKPRLWIRRMERSLLAR